MSPRPWKLVAVAIVAVMMLSALPSIHAEQPTPRHEVWGPSYDELTLEPEPTPESFPTPSPNLAVTDLTISANAWWSTWNLGGSGANDSTSFANRKPIPVNLGSVTVNANVNLTIVFEGVTGQMVNGTGTTAQIRLGAGAVAAKTFTCYGGLYCVDNTNSFLGLLPTTRGGTGIATSIRCAIGGTAAFKNGRIYGMQKGMAANFDMGQDSGGNAVGNVANSIYIVGSEAFFYNCTFKEFINSNGIIIGNGIYSSCNFYGSNNGASVCVYQVYEMGAPTLIGCTHTTSGASWMNIQYGAYVAGTCRLRIVGGLTKGGSGGANINLAAMAGAIVQFYRRAYIKLTSDGTTAISGVSFSAWEATGGMDLPLTAGTTGADGRCKPQSPNVYNDCIWALDNASYYIRTTAGTLDWNNGATYRTFYRNYAFQFTDPTGVYQPAKWYRTMSSDWGTAASPTAITLNRTNAIMTMGALNVSAAALAPGQTLTYSGAFRTDRATTSTTYHLIHNTGAGYAHRWANYSHVANTTVSLATIFGGVANVQFTAALPNTTRTSLLVVSGGTPLINKYYGNLTYSARYRVNESARHILGALNISQEVMHNGGAITYTGFVRSSWGTTVNVSLYHATDLGTTAFLDSSIVALTGNTTYTLNAIFGHALTATASGNNGTRVSYITVRGTGVNGTVRFDCRWRVNETAPAITGHLWGSKVMLSPGMRLYYNGTFVCYYDIQNARVQLYHDSGWGAIDMIGDTTYSFTNGTTVTLIQIFPALVNRSGGVVMPFTMRDSYVVISGGSPPLNHSYRFDCAWIAVTNLGSYDGIPQYPTPKGTQLNIDLGGIIEILKKISWALLAVAASIIVLYVALRVTRSKGRGPTLK